MKIYILNPHYEIIGVIDEYESLLWNKKYNDIGEAEIYLPCNETYLELLNKGNYLYRYDDDMFCKIETVEIETDVENGDYLIASAKDISTILSGRIVRWQIVYSGTVIGFIQKVLTDNVINPEQAQRKIANFEIDKSNFSEFTETIEVSKVADDLLQLIIETCKTHGYGFRVSYNIENQMLVFRLYKGKNKALTTGDEYVEFSPTYANILSSNYKTDDSNYKNVAYVGYKSSNKDDDKVHLLSMFNGDNEPQGEARREIYVDATGTSRDIDIDTLQTIFNGNVKRSPATQGEETSGYYYINVIEDGKTIEEKVGTFEITTDAENVKTEKITVTDYTYLLLIREVGASALADRVKTQEFTGNVDTINTYEYKKDYNLGDVVKVVNDYGIEAEAQITEVMESDDNESGYIIEPKFEFFN